jgi:hypothetical protein
MSYHLTASQVQTLKDFVLHFARKNIETALHIPRSTMNCIPSSNITKPCSAHIRVPDIGRLSLWANNGHARLASSMLEVQLRKGGREDDKQPWLGHLFW